MMQDSPATAAAPTDMRPPGDPEQSATFLQDLHFEYGPDGARDGLRGSLTVTPDSLSPGTDQAALAVLASVADVLTGVPISGPKVVSLTVDLVLRTLRPLGLGSYTITSSVTKRGQTVCVAEATISDGDAAVAHCFATFVPFRLPDDVVMQPTVRRIGAGRDHGVPFHQTLGVEIESPGVATVARRPYTLQPAGTIQGGVICSLVETAACSVLGQPLSDLDVRFLATVRQGPARAVATRLDERTARVTVVDAGADPDRYTAVAIARV